MTDILNSNQLAGLNRLTRGIVWCTTCGRKQNVDPGKCLQSGWPECHGYTMTIDSPEERKVFDKEKQNG